MAGNKTLIAITPLTEAFWRCRDFCMNRLMRSVPVWLIPALMCAMTLFIAPGQADEQRPSATVSLSAVLEGDTQAIGSDIVWRIFTDPTDRTPSLLVFESDAPEPVIQLPPGAYIIHVAYGLSGTTKRIVVGQSPVKETISLNAGGMQLAAMIGDTPVPDDAVIFNVYVAVGSDPEGRLIAGNLKANTVLRLPAGTYRVVSQYGDTNAIMSTDLTIESGKLTTATVKHRAAMVTLKLVRTLGGEAYAGTSFSVLTPGGDTIREAVGAFPSMILAEGSYILIARNGGKVFTQEFSVKSGYDQDIEILMK